MTIKDGTKIYYRTYSYVLGRVTHRGVVVETYPRPNGLWVVVHDKERNKSVTLRPSQLSLTGVWPT